MRSIAFQIAVVYSALIVDAIAFSVIPHPAALESSYSRRISASQLGSLQSDDESEWYSPSAAKPAQVSVARNASPRIRDLDGAGDHFEHVSPSNDDRLSIVLVHASWCKTCLKVMQHYKKMAAQVADHVDVDTGAVVRQGSVRMARLEYGQHEQLCQEQLGVVKLPTILVYRGGDKLASVSCGASQFGRVRELIDELSREHRIAASHVELQDLEAVGDALQRAIGQPIVASPLKTKEDSSVESKKLGL